MDRQELFRALNQMSVGSVEWVDGHPVRRKGKHHWRVLKQVDGKFKKTKHEYGSIGDFYADLKYGVFDRE